MLRIGRMLAGVAVAALIAVSANAAGAVEPVTMPGTSLTLVPPDGFAMANELPGIGSSTGLAYIYATQVDGPIELDIPEARQPEAIKGLVESLGLAHPVWADVISIDSRDFLIGEAVEIRKNALTSWTWMAFADSEPMMAIVFSQTETPQLAADLSRETVIAILQTVKIGAPLFFAERLDATGLAVSPLAPFVHTRMSGLMLVQLSPYEDAPLGGDRLGIYMFRSALPAPDRSLESIGDELLPTDGRVLTSEDNAANFAGGTGLRREGTTSTGLRFVQYVGLINDKPITFMATGPASEVTPKLIETIDRIAATVQSVKRRTASEAGETK